MSFVHLHTHSEYSLLDGAARIQDLVARASDLGMESLALTDHGAMYGSVEFYREAKQAGIKPVLGCEIYFTPGSRRSRAGKPTLHHLLLLAKDEVGYRNLMRMVSRAFLEGFYYRPQVDEELLREHAQGLICTSACMQGIVSKSLERGDEETAREWARKYRDIFGDGDFYLEIQNQGITSESGVTQAGLAERISALGSELGIPVVASNDIHYVGEGDSFAHDILLCVGTGSTVDQRDRMRFSSDQFFMKDEAQMAEALAGHDGSLAATGEVAERCNVELEFGRFVLPVFDVPSGHDLDTYLEERCVAGLERRYGTPVPEQALSRLRTELSVIKDKGFSGYFLIVEDFVRWAKEQGIGVGPGRGSAAGSIISYALGITSLDPLEHGLLFERFLNPEREELPDIDIDFDDERRGEVIDYVRQRYGDDKVAQIITFGTIKARLAVRDAGRVLGYPYGVPDRIAKPIPDGPDASFAASLRENPELREEYSAGGDTKRIVDAARRIEGIVRQDGVHAAGVVICRDPLHHYTPLKRTKGDDGEVVTQYEGELIARLGLLKMDFLGLRTLTVIADAVEAIREDHGVEIDIDAISMDDEATFELLRKADTSGLFQIESPGMKRLLRSMKPTRFADIVALVALYRPGPLQSGMAEDFIARKNGRAEVTYYDDRIRHILEETYGAMVYQEQVMLIAMEMAGFSAAEADKLRKAMGKKKRSIIDKLKREFVEGAIANGYPEPLAQQVYTDIEKFAEYAFNKSHSAAYGLISYQTAYLKAHYPLEYMAAVLTSHMGKTDRLVRYLAACAKAGIEVLPPDVNSSGRRFTVVGDAIRFGLSGIRNVGEGVVDLIVAGRTEGPYTSLDDLCQRVDMRQINKRALESLIKAGAFDSTGYPRRQLMELMTACVERGLTRQRDIEANQTSLFDLEDAAEHGFVDEVMPPQEQEWPKRVKLAFEKEMLGAYVSDHPLRDMEEAVREARTLSLGDVEEFKDGERGWVAGIVTSRDKRVTKSGRMMMTYVLEDLEGSMEGLLFPQMYEKYGEMMTEDVVVRVRVRIDVADRSQGKLITEEVQLLAADTERTERVPGRLDLKLGPTCMTNGGSDRLRTILAKYPGSDVVHAWVGPPGGETLLRLPDDLRVDGSVQALHVELKDFLGEGYRLEG